MKTLILKNINIEKFSFKSVWILVLFIPLLVFIFIPKEFNSIITFALKALMGTIPFILFAISLVAYLKASRCRKYSFKSF
jgi:hypothetical protein